MKKSKLRGRKDLNQRVEPEPAKLPILSTLILFAIVVFSFYLFVFQSYRYKSSIGSISTWGVVLGLAVLPQLWLPFFPKANWKRMLLGIGVIALIISIFLSMLSAGSKFIDFQLNKYGLEVDGQILGTRKERMRHYDQTYLIFSYRVNGKAFTQEDQDNHNYAKRFKGLKVLCSTDKPEIFKIKSFYNKQNFHP